MALSKTVSGAAHESGYADHPEHTISIAPAGRRLKVMAGHAQVADSRDALVLKEADYPPVYYFPRKDISETLLAKRARTSWCPFKGEASYYAIGKEPEHEDVAWSYEDPFEEVAEIRGCLAFYTDRKAIQIIGD